MSVAIQHAATLPLQRVRQEQVTSQLFTEYFIFMSSSFITVRQRHGRGKIVFAMNTVKNSNYNFCFLRSNLITLIKPRMVVYIPMLVFRCNFLSA